MPNWCHNELIISSENSESFWKFMELSGIANNEFKFNNIIPIPEKLLTVRTGSITIDNVDFKSWYENKDGSSQVGIGEKEIESLYHEYGASNWYDWCVKYWGCKWDAANVDILLMDYDSNEAHLHFETPWNPPEELYLYIRMNFPDIDMDWFFKEPGLQFSGWLTKGSE